MRGLRDDLRDAGRMLRRHPGFSAMVVAATALGIGLNTAVFSLLDALLLRPPAVVAPERLVHVYSSVSGDFLSHTPMAFPDYEALRDRARSFGELAAYAWFPLALDRGESSELVMAEVVTTNYFAMLGVVPALGRRFSAFEDRPGSPSPVAILSHDGWRRYFAGSPDVVGREVRLNGQRFTLVGVAPHGFRSLVPGFSPDLWLPIHAAVSLPTGVTISFGGVTPGLERTADRAQRWVWVTGRLRPDASVEQARAEVVALALQLGHEYATSNAQRAFTAVAANDVRLSPGVDRAVWAGSLLAMGAFASFYKWGRDPLMVKLMQLTMTDEAFHHKFGKIWADRTIPNLDEEQRNAIEDWAWEVFQVLLFNLGSPEQKKHIYVAVGLDWQWVQGAFMEAMTDSNIRESMQETSNIFRVLIKTLLKAGIITDRTAMNYATFIDMKELYGEGDRMIGDDIAEEGIKMLRQINGQGGGAYSLDRMSAAE